MSSSNIIQLCDNGAKIIWWIGAFMVILATLLARNQQPNPVYRAMENLAGGTLHRRTITCCTTVLGILLLAAIYYGLCCAM